ncbi:hypothetical protein JW859_02090 [bacterium]|nr:hypothetical protein [bacterium]
MTEQQQEATSALNNEIKQLTAAQCMAAGEFIRLRGVQEYDLARLARLLAEAPSSLAPMPWTEQRLRVQFEDKDKPNLWHEKKKTYAVIRLANDELVGFITEHKDDHGVFVFFDIDQHCADRNELGRDVLRVYRDLKMDWSKLHRLEICILDVEQDKAQWLAATGWQMSAQIPQMYFHLGRPADLQIWDWVAPWAEQLGAGDGT